MGYCIGQKSKDRKDAKFKCKLGVVAQACNPSTYDTEAGGLLQASRPA